MAKYFVRIRGIVHGPVTEQHLERMARRGIVTPNTQVSTDGTTWQRAGDVLSIFASPTTAEPEAKEQLPAEVVQVEATSQWYYQGTDGQAAGPISELEVARLIRSGQLQPHTLVWSQGMPDWKPARETALASYFAPAAPSPAVPASAYASYRPTRGYSFGLPLLLLAEVAGVIVGILGTILFMGAVAADPGVWNGADDLTDEQAAVLGFTYCGVAFVGLLRVVFLVYTVYSWWSALPEGWRRTSPAMAGLGLLIPIFNLFWIFVALGGLADDADEYVRRNGLAVTPPSSGLGYSIAGIACARALLCWLPGVVPLLGLLELILFLAFGVRMSRVCDAIIDHASRLYVGPR